MPTPTTIAAPRLEHVCDLTLTVGQPVPIGQTPAGLRRILPITGGEVKGPRLNGRVLPVGADFQLILGGGTNSQLDARFVIEASDGARIWVQNTALRSASPENARKLMRREPVNQDELYYACQPRLEAAAPAWAWVNDCLFVGTGRREADAMLLSFYRMA